MSKYDDERDEINFFGNWYLRMFAGMLIIGVAISGLVYWGSLSTKKVVNQIEYDARKSDPLVVNTAANRASEIVEDIQKNIRAMKGVDTETKKSLLASNEALNGELARVVKDLSNDQLPLAVKNYQNSLNKQ